MSEPKNTLDPEVIALLEEIAADPNSGLLRVPREPLKKWLAFREPPVSPREPLLTRAERHLVKVHREHVARLLYDACRMTLIKDPIEGTRVHRWVTTDQPLELPLETKWRSQVTHQLNHCSSSSDLSPALRLLERRGGNEIPPLASELAVASLRVAPCDETRIWLGLALHLEEQSRSALHAFSDVLAHHPSDLNKALARANCGFVYFGLGDYGQAIEWSRAAASHRSDIPVALLNWFTASLHVGNTQEAYAAATRLDEVLDTSHSSIPEFIASLRPLSVTRSRKQTLAKVSGRVSPLARSIIDALLPSLPRTA